MRAVRSILAVSAVAGGVGMAGRGILGLRNALKTKATNAIDSGSWVPRQVKVPIVRQEEQDRRDVAMAPQSFPKAADAPLSTLTTRLKQAGGPAEPNLLEKLISGIATKMPDSVAPNPAASYWSVPAMVAGGGAGLYGGWKLVDHFMNKAHDSELDDSLSQSKKDYQQAVSEQFGSLEPKFASLDAVYEKRAELAKEAAFSIEGARDWASKNLPGGMQWANGAANAAHGLGGGYLTALLGVGGGSALAVHKYMKGRSKKRILDKALAKRRQQRSIYTKPIQLVTDEVNADDYETY